MFSEEFESHRQRGAPVFPGMPAVANAQFARRASQTRELEELEIRGEEPIVVAAIDEEGKRFLLLGGEFGDEGEGIVREVIVVEAVAIFFLIGGLTENEEEAFGGRFFQLVFCGEARAHRVARAELVRMTQRVQKRPVTAHGKAGDRAVRRVGLAAETTFDVGNQLFEEEGFEFRGVVDGIAIPEVAAVGHDDDALSFGMRLEVLVANRLHLPLFAPVLFIAAEAVKKIDYRIGEGGGAIPVRNIDAIVDAALHRDAGERQGDDAAPRFALFRLERLFDFLQRGVRVWILGERVGSLDREEIVKENVQDSLIVVAVGVDRHDDILIGHNEAELRIHSVAAEAIMTATPELVAVPLRPVALWIGAVGDVSLRRFVDPRRRDDLTTVPHSLLQQELTELRNIFRLEEEARAALVDPLRRFFPIRMIDMKGLEETRLEIIDDLFADRLLNDRGAHVGAGRIVHEVFAGDVFDLMREEALNPRRFFVRKDRFEPVSRGDHLGGHRFGGVSARHRQEIFNADVLESRIGILGEILGEEFDHFLIDGEFSFGDGESDGC